MEPADRPVRVALERIISRWEGSNPDPTAPKEALANKAVIHSLRSELFQMYVFSAG
jgi:hypothetical protein